jgi:DNA helicase II / ATP-dependent DNA helicase PcrA
MAVQPDEALAGIVRGMQERITVHVAPSERAEAEFVVATIERAVGGHSFFSIDSGRAGGGEAKLSFADFAVLYRTEAQAAVLAVAFARSGIPFRKHSHALLAQDPTVGAVLDALAAADEVDMDLAARLQDAAQRATADKGRSAAIALALERLLLLAERSGGDAARFRDALTLATEAEFWDEKGEGVALLTLHAAKGLEFGCVFVVGLEDGLLPLHWGRFDNVAPDDLAEERRLFYVGMTRAKDRLVLSRALKRLWRGRVRDQAPSPFLADIESELVKQQQAALWRGRADRQLKLL